MTLRYFFQYNIFPHHGKLRRVHKNCYLRLLYTFLAFFFICFVFHHRICVFIIFIFFFWWSIKLTEYQPIRNVNWWFPTVSGTVLLASYCYWTHCKTTDPRQITDHWQAATDPPAGPAPAHKPATHQLTCPPRTEHRLINSAEHWHFHWLNRVTIRPILSLVNFNSSFGLQTWPWVACGRTRTRTHTPYFA